MRFLQKIFCIFLLIIFHRVSKELIDADAFGYYFTNNSFNASVNKMPQKKKKKKKKKKKVIKDTKLYTYTDTDTNPDTNILILNAYYIVI